MLFLLQHFTVVPSVKGIHDPLLILKAMINKSLMSVPNFLDALVPQFVFLLLPSDGQDILRPYDFIYNVLSDCIHFSTPLPNIFIIPIFSQVEINHLFTKRMSFKGIEVQALFAKLFLEEVFYLAFNTIQ